MSTYRDGFGRMKRTAPGHDYRRAHMEGARRMIERGELKPEDFKGRVLAMLKRIFR